MNIRNKYWMASLSLLLSFSLVAPFCCDAMAIDSQGHHQEMQSQAAHGQQSGDTQCTCGHELVKDYQNTKVATSQVLPVFTVMNGSGEAYNTFHRYFSSHFIELPPGLLDDSAPALHLLHSVFLN